MSSFFLFYSILHTVHLIKENRSRQHSSRIFPKSNIEQPNALNCKTLCIHYLHPLNLSGPTI